MRAIEAVKKFLYLLLFSVCFVTLVLLGLVGALAWYVVAAVIGGLFGLFVIGMCVYAMFRRLLQ
jgi:ABC-type multidrug transport system permease subunit